MVLLVPACTSSADEDARDDSFLASGKADTGNVAEGSPEAIGVLRVANEVSLDVLVEAPPDGVGLTQRVVDNIGAVRLGDDGRPGTADDGHFANLAQLDAVPYVGPIAFHHMLEYARAQGWITPSSGVPLSITTYRTGGPVNASLVAVQDGDGSWTALTGTAGVYTTTLHGDRYGVMTSCAFGPFVLYAAISDGTALYLDCADLGPDATISGSVNGAAAANPVRVLDGFFGQADIPAGTTTYSLSTVSGAQKLIAEELVGTRPVKLATVDANTVDGATVNFDLALGFAPVTRAVSASGTIASASLSYRDGHGITTIDRAPMPFNTFRAIPTDKLGGGLNRLVTADAAGSNVIRYFKDPVDQQVSFPAPIQLAQQPTAMAAPYPSVHFQVPVAADASYDLEFSTTNPMTGDTRGLSVQMTSGWIAKAFPGAASFAYTAPDFRGLEGWKTEFQAEAGRPLDWSVVATKSSNVDWYATVPAGVMFDHDGSELRSASVRGQLSAP